MNTIELYLRGLSDKPKKPLTTIECYLQGIKIAPPKPRTVIECYLAGVACDEWQEQDHPRDDDGKFTSSGNRSTGSKKTVVKLSPKEYGKVIHELNNNLSREERKKKIVVRAIGNYRYTVKNNGFNDYEIIRKEKIDGVYD